MKVLRAFALSLLVCSALAAQNAAPLLTPKQQFFDNNGYPLSGGLIYTCVAGSSCPGTPLATYTDSTAGTQNANPVVLDAAGRAAIWGGSSNYKIVVQDASGNTISTQDNVPAGSFGASSSITSTLAGSGGAALVGYAATDGAAQTVAGKLTALRRDAIADFHAKGDNSTDDTAALQACLNWAQSHMGTCYLPPAKYKISGMGLTITGSANLASDAPYGEGGAQIWYYGTGSALTVGTDVSTLTYATTLQNVSIVIAAGYTAQYGINVLGLSEAHWYGVGISGNSTGGKFTTALRFVDSGALVIDGLVIANQAGSGSLGTTAVLFDSAGGLGYGDNNIVIKHSDIYFESKVFDVRSCDSCHIQDAINIEAFDYLLNFDNTSGNTGLNSLWFTNNSVTADQTGSFANRKIVNINAVATNSFYLYQLALTGNRFQLTGGNTYPIVASINSSHGNGFLNVRIADNSFVGANTAVVNVTSQFSWAHFSFGQNHVNDATGATRTPDIVANATGSAYYLDETAPVSTSFLPLAYGDVNGTRYFAGSTGTSMTRPAFGAAVAGALYGVDQNTPGNTNGFLRVGTTGGSVATYASYCDFSGYSTVTDMDRNIMCSVYGSEILRMNSAGVKVTGALTLTAGVTATGYTAGSSAGLTVVKNLTGSTGSACTETFTGGLLTASTCP